jgi:hypothetical protein
MQDRTTDRPALHHAEPTATELCVTRPPMGLETRSEHASRIWSTNLVHQLRSRAGRQRGGGRRTRAGNEVLQPRNPSQSPIRYAGLRSPGR